MTILLNYMQRRLQKEEKKPVKKPQDYGPVVTISRQYGCLAKDLAASLEKKLNELKRADEWHWVGKEILEKSAKELKLKTEVVQEIGEKRGQGILEDILMTFGNKYYPGDIKVRRTIGEVIHAFAEKGNYIIVGRGGASICKNITKSLHVRLVAPLEWRVNEVSKRHNVSVEDAEKMIYNIDKKREIMLEYFEGNKVNDYLFDVVFNYMKTSEKEVMDSIIQLMKNRNMI